MAIGITTILVLALAFEAHSITIRDCLTRSVTPDESRILRLLCTRIAIATNNIVLANPSDNTMFLVCSDVHFGCAGQCAGRGIFNTITKSCGAVIPVLCPLPANTDLTIPARSLERNIPNPCTRTFSGRCFYFPHTTKNRFIICNRNTISVPKVRQCLPGFEFNLGHKICEKPNPQVIRCNNLQNPCKPIADTNHMISVHELYYACADDTTKFIQCDRWGHMYVKQCQNNTHWSQAKVACA